MEMVKENLLEKILYFVLFFVTTSFIFATYSYGDTYNFHFSKEKKKKSHAQQEASYGDEGPSEDEGEEEEVSEPKPAPKTVEKAPVVIHNINTITNPPVAPPAPAPVVAPPTPAPVAQAPVLEQKVSLPEKSSPMQLGVGLDIPFHLAAPAPMISLAYRPNMLGLNFYFGGMLKTYEKFYRAGAELEVYPLATRLKDALIEPALLAGVHYEERRDSYSDDWGFYHVGARVGLNFSKDFALTAVVRATDSPSTGKILTRLEAGIAVRL